MYPNPAKRLAPDFFFHNQIYRHDGESVVLPPGRYTALLALDADCALRESDEGNNAAATSYIIATP